MSQLLDRAARQGCPTRLLLMWECQQTFSEPFQYQYPHPNKDKTNWVCYIIWWHENALMKCNTHLTHSTHFALVQDRAASLGLPSHGTSRGNVSRHFLSFFIFSTLTLTKTGQVVSISIYFALLCLRAVCQQSC